MRNLKTFVIAAFSTCLLSVAASATPMKDGAMMKDGKMMMMKDGKSMMMDEEMTATDGTKVMKDGTVMMKDGKKMMMKDGEMVGEDGKMMMMKDGKMEAMPMHDTMMKQ